MSGGAAGGGVGGAGGSMGHGVVSGGPDKKSIKYIMKDVKRRKNHGK